MERNLYIIFIAVVVFIICLIYFILSRREKRKSQELISKTMPTKLIQNELKQESKTEEVQQEHVEENLETFVIDKEEKSEAKPIEEAEFDYKKFVDDNIDSLSKFHGYDEFVEFQETEKDSFKDVLDPILFGNQNLDED